ncbi:hypothetical protein BKA66DRAFT_439201 [Pyrenochaeta sp. MPI-SDFR-AT-0127]|nr:hypothetical protein BKA66DRAFT_439201 [Pyrenochaeta sp. MPI-SDFR-AT-0127]
MRFLALAAFGAATVVQPVIACLTYNYSINPANKCMTIYFNDDNQQICQGTVCSGDSYWTGFSCPNGYRVTLSDNSNPRRFASMYITWSAPHGLWSWTQNTNVGGPPYTASGNHFC